MVFVINLLYNYHCGKLPQPNDVQTHTHTYITAILHAYIFFYIVLEMNLNYIIIYRRKKEKIVLPFRY